MGEQDPVCRLTVHHTGGGRSVFPGLKGTAAQLCEDLAKVLFRDGYLWAGEEENGSQAVVMKEHIITFTVEQE